MKSPSKEDAHLDLLVPGAADGESLECDILCRKQLLEKAKAVMITEANAVLNAADHLDDTFVDVVEMILQSKGRIFVSGVGKSGHVGHKIAATLTSTGTSAYFIHPVEALHGDLGAIAASDIAILISNSGETLEVLQLAQYLRSLGVPMISITSKPQSTLGRLTRHVMDLGVLSEACPLNLAPTSSTTVTLVLGDALAVSLLLRRGFTRDDFARFHPAGALGRLLTQRVSDVMIPLDNLRALDASLSVKDALTLLAKQRGFVPVTVHGDTGVIFKAVTSNDAERMLNAGELDAAVALYATELLQVRADALTGFAKSELETAGVEVAFVEEAGQVVGIVHLADLQ
eukprot:TRINITY_DN14678_c0_g1_i1.p1 TRINITY_DN14678_c0_g1~~TRINITY_DN14678_c0_g1_i1.p1  ORF type:complete len:344 (+),score=54.57 TRINITY_DN14678_c0_g1_i1:68-1099(+)